MTRWLFCDHCGWQEPRPDTDSTACITSLNCPSCTTLGLRYAAFELKAWMRFGADLMGGVMTVKQLVDYTWCGAESELASLPSPSSSPGAKRS